MMDDDSFGEGEPQPITHLPSSKAILQAYLEHRSSNSSENKRHAIVPHVYHASEGGYCVRQLFYKHKGLPGESDKPLGIFIMGELVEEVMTDAYKWFFGDDKVTKRPIHIAGEGWVVTGSTDCIIDPSDIIPDHPLVQKEIKSNARGKKAMPQYHQMCQAAVYAKYLAIPHNFVVHPSRNDPLNMPEEDFELSPELVERLYSEVMDRFARLDKALVEDKLPPATPPKNKQCDFCPFKTKCQDDGCQCATPDKCGWTPYGDDRDNWVAPDSQYGDDDE